MVNSKSVSIGHASPGFLQRLRSLVEALFRAPPPLMGDGLNDADAQSSQAETGIIRDLISQGKRIPEDLDLLLEVLQTLRAKGLIDDRDYLIEKIIQLASSLPPHSANQVKLTGQLIRSLWNTLPHPPHQYIGTGYLNGLSPEVEVIDLKYRTADGSNYNILYPNLGRASTPYARSVPAKTPPPAVWPDAGLLFDTLFARDEIIEHPTKTSSMLFYLAVIIIHDGFRTDPADQSRSNTSSYLDLAPLYGSTVKEQQQVRTMVDGKLKPDCFNEPRILGFPPGVGVFLICFNRFHNYVATQLAAINEKQRFTKPAPLSAGREHSPDEEARYAKAKKYDEELFQTSRLVTCGLYANIILNDYVKNILNFNRTESSWTLDPRGDYGHVHDETTVIPSAEGNQVSAEFNLIYRWHACVSERDTKWTEDFFENELEAKDPDTLTAEELKELLKRWGHSIPADPGERTFGGWKRQKDLGGAFLDADLVAELTKSTEDIAGSFGPKNIPKVLRAIEVMGIEQARSWNVATLNEFRQFYGLKPHDTFEHINPDPEIARSLRIFYNHPDSVELYPGILAEDAKKAMVPGSGLCASFTISKAILSDAVAFIRSDRFYTKDYTPANLTNWGFTEVSSDPDVVQGRVLYKLFHHAFPGWYRSDSVYAMFPFTVPSETKMILEGFGTAGDYHFDPPKLVPPWKQILTHRAVREVLGDQQRFHIPWGPHICEMTKQDYMISDDKPANKQQREEMLADLYGPKHGLDQIAKFYEATTLNMIQQKSYQLGGCYEVDAVRDIGNLVHAHFASELFEIPLKTQENPRGIFTERELYQLNAVLFTWVFLDVEPVVSFRLRKAARKATAALTGVIEPLCKAIKYGEPVKDLKDAIHKDHGYMSIYGRHMIQRMLEGKTVAHTVSQIIPTTAASVANQAQGFAQVLDMFLSDDYEHHWRIIQGLARDKTDPEGAFRQLRKYAWEGSRLAPAAFGIIREAVADSAVIQDGPKQTVNVKKGDSLFLNLITSSIDPTVFPNPHGIDLTRPEELYIQYGYGPHSCIGTPVAITALASMLRVFGRLDNIRRAPGPAGELKSVTKEGMFRTYMTESWNAWSPFPTTMKIQFDGIAE